MDIHQSLIEHFKKKITLDPSSEKEIISAYSLHTFKKKELIFQQGQGCLVEGYIVSGLVRVFNTDQQGIEHVMYFALNDWWIGDIASFYRNEPAVLSAQAMDETQVLVIDPENKEALFKKVPQLERFFRILTQNNLSVVQKRLLMSHSASAKDRYLELINRSPEIEQLVPQYQIASYLGILPESLSRLKKQLIKNDQKS